VVAAVLTLERVTKYFGTKRALHDVSLALQPGDRLALLGDNGSGKSTLLAVASGVMDPDRGRVHRPPSVGYAPEKPDIPDHLLVSEWLDVVASLKGVRVEGVDALAVGALLGRRIAALSTGQRQRVSLCAAFLGNPTLLVFDEPTNGLDDETRAVVLDRLRTTTVLFSTHDVELVNQIDAGVIRLKDGRQVTTPLGDGVMRSSKV
jgi:ABC-type multidrug transport system ATPase subunit